VARWVRCGLSVAGTFAVARDRVPRRGPYEAKENRRQPSYALTSLRHEPRHTSTRDTGKSKLMETFHTKSTGALVGLVGFMPPRRGSVQIDRGGSGSGVFGALRAPATVRLIVMRLVRN
jgi:hypothetical protein